MKGVWVEPDKRDEIIDFINHWSERTEIKSMRLVDWIGISRSKHARWQKRYGMALEHNGRIPRDHWLEDWEKAKIRAFQRANPLEGYRRLSYMMLDQDIVAVSPSSTYRVLKQAGLLQKWSLKPSKKGTGFVQPLVAHQHWHIDISYLKICGTFYYLCSALDGFSRYIVHWDIREQMREADVEIILQRAREQFPETNPRIISDNGPQFIAKDFKEFIRIMEMSHVRTSPYYPQSNGKIERWHGSIKSECIRPGTPLSLEDAKRLAANYIDHYNNERLHSAIGYITPKDKLAGRAELIFSERDRKLEAAREVRKQKRLKSYQDQSNRSSSLSLSLSSSSSSSSSSMNANIGGSL